MESDLSLPKHILWVLLLAVKDPTPPHGASKVGPGWKGRGCEGGDHYPRPRGRQAQEAPLCPEPTGSSSAQQKGSPAWTDPGSLRALEGSSPPQVQALHRLPPQPRWAGAHRRSRQADTAPGSTGLLLLNHPTPTSLPPLDKSRRGPTSVLR